MNTVLKRVTVIMLIVVLALCTCSMMSFGADKVKVVENSPYQGKTISILGDSISTFAGYIPEDDGMNLAHRAKYPNTELLKNVNQTWWMQLILQLDATLGVNDSWAGSTVSNAIDGNMADWGEDAAMASLTRIQNLGSNGTPDVILFYGGTNDIGLDVVRGSFHPARANFEVDLESTKWTTFADAYADTLMRLQYFYPNAEIIAMLPTFTEVYYSDWELEFYNSLMMDICNHYGVRFIDLRDVGLTCNYMPDGIHPNAEGMDLITQAVQDVLLGITP